MSVGFHRDTNFLREQSLVSDRKPIVNTNVLTTTESATAGEIHEGIGQGLTGTSGLPLCAVTKTRMTTFDPILQIGSNQ